MNYSLGCAFTLDDIIMNFPYKTIQFSCEDAYNITGDLHRNILIKKIFLYNVKLVLNDIILNNVTFNLPLSGSKKCNIRMKGVRGEEFKRLRRGGKWLDVDIVNSFFTGYSLSFYMLGKRTPRVKSVYLSKQLRDLITANTNNGMAYGDGKTDTTISDYLDEIYEQFPSINKSDINRILSFCWKSVYLHNSYGGDTLLSDRELWCYIGNLRKDPLDHFYYYIRKLSVKLRVLYKRKKIEWDGYYYFALNDSQYLNYLALKNKRGRPKRNFNFGTVCLYQLKDECLINEHASRCIFRVPFISQLKMKNIIYNFESSKAELILEREPLKFKDILVYENEYDVL